MSDSSPQPPSQPSSSLPEATDSMAAQARSEPLPESLAAWQEVDALFDAVESTSTPGNPARPLTSPSPRWRVLDPHNPIVMVETAFLASAASLIWLINFYFPIGPVLRIFFPIPIALIYLRRGDRAAWMGTLTTGLLLSVLMGPPRSVLYVMPFGLMGVLLGWLWARGARWGLSIVLGGLLCTIGFFFRIWLTSILLNEDLWLYANNQVTGMLDWFCTWLGLLVQPQVWLVQLVAVGMIVVSQLLYTFVVHLVAVLMFEKLKTPIPPPPHWVQVLLEND